MNPPTSTNPVTAPAKFGVYCLANDQAMEWFQMFVRSFRHFNPTLPLTIIPYNAKVAQLKLLASQFHFDLLPEAEVSRFDALETKIMKLGHHPAMFRKWAAFFGHYDEFIFFDADVAVTMPLDDLLQAFAGSSYDFLYFDTDIMRVYRPEHVADMQAKYHSPGFNAGTFASRKGVVTEAELWRMADAAVVDYHLLKPDQVDQPFLNYVFDTLPRRTVHVNTLRPEIAPPRPQLFFRHDTRHERLLDAEGRQMLFIHWAGHNYPGMMLPEIFLQYRTLGMSDAERQRYRRYFCYRRLRNKLKRTLLRIKPAARPVSPHK